MTKATIPTVKLNNGVEMPVLGFGVFQIPADQTEQAVGAHPFTQPASFLEIRKRCSGAANTTERSV